jgi:hypothetical protein
MPAEHGEVPESGRSGLPAKEVWCNSHRGFESHPLRHIDAGRSVEPEVGPVSAGPTFASGSALHGPLQSESLFIRSAGWPPDACRPPTWPLWENTTPLPSGRRLTAKSPLAEFHQWRVEAGKDIALFGIHETSQFAEGWAHGARRTRRRPS